MPPSQPARPARQTHNSEALGGEALAAWQEAVEDTPEVVVRPAIPILYFGDLPAYLGSPRKIITVGLNPSRAEFPREEPFRRFPLAGPMADGDVTRYVQSLNEYFTRAPYRSWFGTFEPILHGAGASFYPGAESTALHTDLCSPVATDPTWNRLSGEQKSSLIERGRPLWHELVRLLVPDVILVSVARSHVAEVAFERVGDAWELFRLDRSRPYSVTATPVRISEEKDALLVFGRAAQRPFGTIKAEAKRILGGRLVEAMDA